MFVCMCVFVKSLQCELREGFLNVCMCVCVCVCVYTSRESARVRAHERAREKERERKKERERERQRERKREREREREGEREREREREKRIYVLIYELFLYPETLQHVGSTGTHDLICILGNVMSTKEGSGQAERRQRRRARWKY